MQRILIQNGHVVTMDQKRSLIKGGSIIIEGDRIVEVGKEVKGTADITIDAQGKAVIPGLINCHTHLAMTLLRGVADDMELKPWLEQKIWPLEKHLNAERVRQGSLLGALEMIKSGTTCFADQYFYMEEVAKAVEQSGLRGVLSYGIIEMGDPIKRKSELEAGERLVKTCQGMANGRVTTMFGPHAPYTCSPECLMQVKDLARKYNVGIHTHIAETKWEVDEIMKKYGKAPVEYLDSIGFLGPEVLAAHSIYLAPHGISIYRNKGVKPVHNPVSNMKLGSGVAPVPDLARAGVPVALGTDGAASNNALDMFNEMKFAALLNKVSRFSPTVMPAQYVLDMATINGAIALGREKDLGSLEAGKKADIVLVDLKKPHLTPVHNIISHLVYSAVGSDVDTVIVDGNILMQLGKVQSLDEEQVIRDAQGVSESMLSEASKK